MFIHNLKYTLKSLFKNKSLIFWTFAFPIILGTLFNAAFKDITNSEKLNVINIAIVQNNEFEKNEIYRNTFKELGNPENEERIFEITYISEEEAKELLDKNKISGYLEIKNGEPKIVCKKNGLEETLFKYIIEEIETKTTIINSFTEQEINKNIEQGNYDINYTEILNNVQEKLKDNNINIKNIANENLDYTMIEYYTLIAMTCLYGGMLGMYAINQKLPNMCNIGKRTTIAPIKKKTIITSSLLAAYIVQLIGLALLFAYTIFIIKVDYGVNVPLIILLSIIGSITGLTLGIAVGSIFKINENAKIGILISITMLGCFLSGMMGITMKYIVDKNIPIINKINPAAIITDGFYSLYYYNTLDRYWINIISLLTISLILIIISILSIRRQKYDNI